MALAVDNRSIVRVSAYTSNSPISQIDVATDTPNLCDWLIFLKHDPSIKAYQRAQDQPLHFGALSLKPLKMLSGSLA